MGEADRTRTCVGCRRRRARPELLRIARTPHGVRFDPQARLPGRGAYLCPDLRCVTAAESRDGQALRRALRGAPAAEVQEALDEIRQAIGHEQDEAGKEPGA